MLGRLGSRGIQHHGMEAISGPGIVQTTVCTVPFVQRSPSPAPPMAIAAVMLITRHLWKRRIQRHNHKYIPKKGKTNERKQ